MSHFLSYFFSAFIFLLPFVYSFATFQVFEVNKFVFLLFFTGFFLVFFSLQFSFEKIKKYILFIFLASLPFLLSVWFSTTPIVSLFGSAERHMGLVTFLCAGIVFFIAQHLAHQKKQDIILVAMLSSGFIVALYSIFQWWLFPLPDPLFGGLDAKSMSYRAFAFLGQPNFIAQLLIIPFFIGVERFKNTLLFLIPWVLVFAFAFFATGSRAALVAVLGGFLAYFLFQRQGKKYVFLAFVPAIFIWLIVFFGGSFFEFSERGSSFLARHFFWQDALHLWLSNAKIFFLGTGADVLSSTWKASLSYKSFAAEYFLMLPDRAHSLFLDMVVQWGIVVFALACVFLVRTLQKIEDAGIMAACVGIISAWFFGFFVITDFVFFITLAGISWAKTTSLFEKKKHQNIITRLFFIGLTLFCWGLAVLTWNADKAFFKKNIALAKKAPFLETNLASLYFTALPSEKKEIVQMANFYHFSSREFAKIQFLEHPTQQTFEKWWHAAGNNPLEKLKILLTVKSFGILLPSEYNALAKTVIAQLPNREDDSFLSKKVWKHLENDEIWKSLQTEIEQLKVTLQ